MLTVLVEGIDGAGKTTLCGSLCGRLESLGREANELPKLGHFLPCENTLEGFRHWLEATPLLEVNREMLRASHERLKTAQNVPKHCTSIVDRGPATVYASCIARLRQQSRVSMDTAVEALQSEIENWPLYPLTQHCTIYLSVLSLDLVKTRKPNEFTDAKYIEYLGLLNEALKLSTSTAPGLIRFDAREDTDTLVSTLLISNSAFGMRVTGNLEP